MAKRGAVEQLGSNAQNKAIKLNVEGLTYQAIADKFNEENNSALSSEDVKNFLRRKTKATAMLIKEDKNFKNKLAQTYFDTVQGLKNLNSECWKLFYEIKKDPEYVSKSVECPKCSKKFSVQLKTFSSLLKAADALLNQIKHVDTILGRMQKKSLNVTYNYVDLSKKIGIVMPNLLVQLEKKGVLKLNKKKLKQFYGGTSKVEDDFSEEEEKKDEEDEFNEEDLD
jgi:DNA-directed RNA polymerase subunit RPC12/RpoP